MMEADEKELEKKSKARHPSNVHRLHKEPEKPQDDRTWRDLVHQVAQEYCEYGVWQLSDDEMDFLLWECTAFPMASEETVRKQLREEFERMAEEQWSHRQEGQ